ncbi:unnamed protein product [Schistosoma margrebowiei]|uniref:Uncharacterized protein n=1 Tax=Schistosoma margrebowiei TaxID=48269 RepID=A0A183MBM8_9TREM|nr:unnamed protein product [Schistosoma margrebowiei]
MVIRGSQQEILNLGFVLFGNRQQDLPVTLWELMLIDRFDPVSPSSTFDLMSQLKLDQHGKLGSTGWPFRFNVGIFTSVNS